LRARRQVLTAKKSRGNAKEIAAITELEQQLVAHLDRLKNVKAAQDEEAEDEAARQQMEATRREAKGIYLQEGRTGGLKALSPGNAFFQNPIQDPGVGVAQDLDSAEIAALSTYTADDYKYINPAAAFNKGWLGAQTTDPNTGTNKAGQKGTERERLEEGGLHTGMVMSAFAKLPVWNGDGFRGERLTPDEFAAQYNVAAQSGAVTAKTATTTREAFWSVSTQRSVAEGFAGGGTDTAADKTVAILYLIKISNARDIAQFSRFPEAEVLCPPGSKYSITNVDPKTSEVGTGTPAATAYYEVTIKQT
jgi:hypothetical protein